MTLTTEIAKTTRDLVFAVVIDGTLIQPHDETSLTGTPGLLGLTLSKSFDSPVPTASIKLNRIPNWITRGSLVQVYLGYNGQFVRVFNGTVQDRSDGTTESFLNCVGNLWKLFRGIEISERDLTGLNVKTALEDILDDVNIGASERNTADVPSTFSLGSSGTEPKLQRQRSSQMAQTLMDIEGVRVYEDGNGIAHFRVITGAPSAGAFRSYSTNVTATARILGGGIREDPTYTRTKVTVRGATVVEGVAPDETSRVVEATAILSAENKASLIKPALASGQDVESEYSNSLIDTDLKVAEVAERLLVQFARVPKSLTFEIPGDPEIELGITISLKWPELNASGNWFVQGIQHLIDRSGYRTVLDLRGGPEFGIDVNIKPIASFDFDIDREVFADRVQAVVTFDASNSRDPDSEEALLYAWSDNQTTTPDIALSTEAVHSVRIDPGAIVGTWSVTLTVTDTEGNTAAITRDVDVAETASLVEIPAIYAAIDNRESASRDGGQNWDDQTDVGVISVGARPDDGVNVGQAIYGTSDGKLLKTLDACATALTEVHSVASVRFEAVEWDWRDPNRVWALDDDLVLYLSEDEGDTWAVYDDVGNIFGHAASIGRTIGLPRGGGVWVYGGTGANNPFIGFDREVGRHNWTELAFGGELAADLPALSAAVAIVDAVDKGDASGMCIALEDADDGAGTGADLFFARGTYAGNGTNQDIIGLGFQPKVVIVQGDDGTNGRALLMTDTLATAISLTDDDVNAGIDALLADGFGVTALTGDDSRVNESGVTYYWYAFGGAGCLTGTYTGDGNSLKGVTGLGARPKMVNVKESGATTGMAVATREMNNFSYTYKGSDGRSSTGITSLDADGFAVGSDLNADGTTYHHWALMPSPQNLSTGSWIGDGTDDRDVPSAPMGFVPEFVFVRVGSNSTAEPAWRNESIAGDNSFDTFGPAALAANLIQDLTPATAGLIEVGDDLQVNNNANLPHFFVAVDTNSTAETGDVRPVYHTSSPFVAADWERATGFGAADTDAEFIVGAPGFPYNFIMAFGDRAAWKSVDGVDWEEVADVLPANHVFRHAIWGFSHTHNFFLASFYLAAVEDTVGQTGGIYKSTDEFSTALGLLRPATGFDTWPSAAIGRQVSLGRSQAAEGRFLIVSDENPGTIVAWRDARVDWTTYRTLGFNVPGTPLDIFRTHAFTNKLWAILGWDSATDPDSGQVLLTRDGGVTWVDPLPPPANGGLVRHWHGLAYTSDDVLWGITSDDADDSHIEIWKSIDLGDSWTEVYDVVGGGAVNYRFFYLVANPTDPKTIVAFGTHDGSRRKPAIHFTRDGGVTWNVNDFADAILANGSLGRTEDVFFTTANRLIHHNAPDLNGLRFYVTPDFGASWQQGQDFVGTLGIDELKGIDGERDGARIYTIYKDATASPDVSDVYVSTDGGLTWTNLNNPIPVLNASHSLDNGFAFDPVEKALYTYGTGVSWTPNTDHIWKLFPISEDGTWVDVSGRLLPWEGETSYSGGADNCRQIAVIPRA